MEHGLFVYVALLRFVLELFVWCSRAGHYNGALLQIGQVLVILAVVMVVSSIWTATSCVIKIPLGVRSSKINFCHLQLTSSTIINDRVPIHDTP